MKSTLKKDCSIVLIVRKWRNIEKIWHSDLNNLWKKPRILNLLILRFLWSRIFGKKKGEFDCLQFKLISLHSFTSTLNCICFFKNFWLLFDQVLTKGLIMMTLRVKYRYLKPVSKIWKRSIKEKVAACHWENISQNIISEVYYKFF